MTDKRQFTQKEDYISGWKQGAKGRQKPVNWNSLGKWWRLGWSNGTQALNIQEQFAWDLKETNL